MALHTFLAKISDGQTPADVATLGMIIDAWKRATLALVSVDGEPEETALSLYLNGNSPDAEIVKTMLAKAPKTARTKNAAGDYPLVTFLRTIDREPDRDGEEEGLEKHFNLVRQASTAALKGTGEVVNLGAHHVNYAVTGEGTVWLCGGSPPPRPPLRWNTPQTHLDPSRRSRQRFCERELVRRKRWRASPKFARCTTPARRSATLRWISCTPPKMARGEWGSECAACAPGA